MTPQEDSPAPAAVASKGEPIDFAVVGIGASAGGLAALREFFEQMPSGSGMAFVVILHLSPKHESHLDSVLQGVTSMRVEQVNHTVKIEPDHVYVIPPTRHLQMVDGKLILSEPLRDRTRHTAIDLFFRTLAYTHRSRAIGIVLSGTGSDGAVGLQALKEQGVVAIAQDPQDAENDAMPRNAIATGAVDFVLSARDMPQRVLQVWQNAQRIDVPAMGEVEAVAESPRGVDEVVADILRLVRARTGQDFMHYKRGTILRRIERRLQVNQLPNLATYRDHLRENPEETPRLLRDLLISVTNFFRDAAVFDALKQTVVPALFDNKGPEDAVRVWVPGCATGEEAYSLVMLLMEHADTLDAPPQLQVFATDIDEAAIAFGRVGLYPEGIAADVSPARLRRFFVREADGYRVHKSLREGVTFAAHNVIDDPPFSRLDLVSCRNLLIYLQRSVQVRVLDILHFALNPRGFLVVGTSESVEDGRDMFGVEDRSHRIFRSTGRARPGAFVPGLALPAGGDSPAPIVPLTQVTPPRPPKPSAYGQFHQALLEHYAPPSVVINDQFHIVHLSDTVSRFLEFAPGEPSLCLPDVVVPALRLELRSALYQALQTMQTVRARAALDREDGQVRVTLGVHPVRDTSSGRVFMLVMFDEHMQPAPAGRADDDARPAAEQLDDELRSTREQLRATIEQYETQNEELKAGNEELQAINEELRSATEELETSKEELQSINEELTTVKELKNKIDEATGINNDLQNLIASTEIAVVFVDRRLRLMRYTPSARSIFNVIPTDVGRPLGDITHRLDYPSLQQDVEHVFDTLRNVEREVRSDNARWYLARILPYRTSDDRIEGAVLTFLDITSRKETDDKLLRNEAWMGLVVDGVRDYAIFTVDRDGNVMTWNAGAQRIFGYTSEEIVGKPTALLFTPEDRAAGAPHHEMEQALAEGRAEDERWHLRRDGTRFYCSGVMASLVDGKLLGFVKIARDLTPQQQVTHERDAALERERASRADLEAANRQKDQFLATLSHELRNPLNLILMQAQLLLRTDAFKDPKGRHNAEIIYQTAATQARLVDDLLDMSRVVTGKLAMQQQLVPLPFIVGDSIGGLSREADQKGVSLDVELTAEPLIVQADPVRVRQIAWNLLSNAIKFTPSGGRVKVSLVREDGDARLDIVDTGRGIEASMLPHIFDLFQRGEYDVERRPEGGLGIGLALVHQLVELHQGRIEVHSEGRGKGARFSVWLPLYSVAPPELRRAPGPQDNFAAVLPNAARPRDAKLSGISVLVIDDGQDSVEALRELLRMEGANAMGAVDAQQALDLTIRHRFDVIISDLAMPGMDGYTLLRKIRAAQVNQDTPAIVLTGFNRSQDIERSLREGFAMHLSKPVTVVDLVKSIHGVARPT